ncbi:MAG: radical SAM protein [Clostridiales bacterium]|nr:radical SAM protein [Clostridiales bacterium]
MACIKPSYNTERIILGERLPLEAPLALILDTSSRCNFKCIYCYRSGKKDESWGYAALGEIMPPEVFERTVEQLREFSQTIKSVSLSGHGEPMCNPHLANFARLLSKSGVVEQIEMHTNASLLTKDNVADIAKSGFTRIVISLQGLDAATYERVCGVPIDWESMYGNIKLLYKSKPDILKLHVKISDAALEEGGFEENKDRFYALFGDIADSVFVERAVPLWKNINIDRRENKFGYDFSYIEYCPLVFYKILVAPSGDIFPCTNLAPPISLGNIGGTTLREAWNSKERVKFLIEHLQLTRKNHTPCIGCFVPENSVTSCNDIIDPYKDAVLDRLKKELDDGRD